MFFSDLKASHKSPRNGGHRKMPLVGALRALESSHGPATGFSGTSPKGPWKQLETHVCISVAESGEPSRLFILCWKICFVCEGVMVWELKYEYPFCVQGRNVIRIFPCGRNRNIHISPCGVFIVFP